MQRPHVIAQAAQPDQAGIVGVERRARVGKAAELLGPIVCQFFVPAKQMLKEPIDDIGCCFELLELFVIALLKRSQLFVKLIDFSHEGSPVMLMDMQVGRLRAHSNGMRTLTQQERAQ